MKHRLLFGLVLLALICFLFAGPALAAKRYSAERFDVVLEVEADGSLVVTETIRFRFEGGPFTYAFRDLAYTEIDEIDRLQASMDGAVLPHGTGPGQVEVVLGRPLQVTWHFAPTSDAAREFVLTYRVQGAIRKEEGADVLIWRAIPEEHDYDIERSTITLRYSVATSLVSTPQLSGAVANRESGDGQVKWNAASIDADESLVVTARFAPGSLVQVPPRWQASEEARRQQTARAMPVGLAAGLLTLGLGLSALTSFLVRRRCTGPAVQAPLVRASTPPDEAPPGLAIRLAQGGMPALATLFDLAGRGLLQIEESGKGLLGSRQYRLNRSPASVELRPHEQGLLRVLFEEKGGGQGDSLPLSKVATRLSSRGKWYREPLEEEMDATGWLDPDRHATRKRLVALGIVAVLIGGVVMIGGFVAAGLAVAREAGTAVTLAAAVAGVGVAFFLLGLTVLIAGAVFSPLSARGKAATAAWKSFAAYLKDIVRGREFVAGEALFERYLPFAAGFGLGERWARHFEKQGYAAIPAWFRALEADAGDFGAVVAAMATTSSSFSSGGAAGAGAAGASGGGASGAG